MAKVLVLRTCKADGTSHGGFQWPTSGPVECPDWNPRPECGNGLYGLLWAEGNAGLLAGEVDAIWQIVEVEADSVVKIDDQKVKFPRCTVVYSGKREVAIQMILDARAKVKRLLTLVKATTGDYAHSATTGYSAHSATTGDYAHSATTGDNSIAVALGKETRVKAGEKGVIAMSWQDKKADRVRLLVGYVGEDGIESGVWYEAVSGKWKKSKNQA